MLLIHVNCTIFNCLYRRSSKSSKHLGCTGPGCGHDHGHRPGAVWLASYSGERGFHCKLQTSASRRYTAHSLWPLRQAASVGKLIRSSEVNTICHGDNFKTVWARTAGKFVVHPARGACQGHGRRWWVGETVGGSKYSTTSLGHSQEALSWSTQKQGYYSEGILFRVAQCWTDCRTTVMCRNVSRLAIGHRNCRQNTVGVPGALWHFWWP